jgi:hypothetical protein
MNFESVSTFTNNIQKYFHIIRLNVRELLIYSNEKLS